MTTTEGALLIAKERRRQVDDEKYVLDHDRGATDALVWAAIAYLVATEADEPPPPCWPWADYAWKPGPDRIRRLTKAGALVAAALDVLIEEATDA